MTGRRCERVVGTKRCDKPALLFVMGEWACAIHHVVAADNCSHSLVSDGRCSYCGSEAP